MSKPLETPPVRSGHAPRVAEGSANEFSNHRHDIFFAAVETTRMPMLVTDPRQPDNPIAFANRAFLSMTGYDESEIVGRNCRFLQGPLTDRRTIDAVREAVAQRREISVELLNYRKDGSTFWNALFISPVYNRAGELVYFFASQLDVSRRRDAEDSLARAQRMDALGQLTGGIAHDFNNLLQVMSGHLDLLRVLADTGRIDAGRVLSTVSKVRSAVATASSLTQQLLAFSRQQRLYGRTVNVNALVKGMSELTQRTLGEHIGLDFRLDPALPNSEIDPTQFEVALLNVLVNARDAMPQGGHIRIETREVRVADTDQAAFAGLAPGRYAMVVVKDGGGGIAPELLGRVMEPFFTTKENGKGTGLGLAMVYGFVKQSGGTVAIESALGVGTTVRMYFPTTDRSIDAAAAPVALPEARGRGESVLLVEDRAEVADVAEAMLVALGYEVQRADSAAAALSLLRNALAAGSPPRLLFSDVVMPGGMDGHALAREARRLQPSIKVLLATGFDGSLASTDADSAGEFELMPKPYGLNELARRVRAVIDGVTGDGT